MRMNCSANWGNRDLAKLAIERAKDALSLTQVSGVIHDEQCRADVQRCIGVTLDPLRTGGVTRLSPLATTDTRARMLCHSPSISRSKRSAGPSITQSMNSGTRSDCGVSRSAPRSTNPNVDFMRGATPSVRSSLPTWTGSMTWSAWHASRPSTRTPWLRSPKRGPWCRRRSSFLQRPSRRFVVGSSVHQKGLGGNCSSRYARNCVRLWSRLGLPSPPRTNKVPKGQARRVGLRHRM